MHRRQFLKDIGSLALTLSANSCIKNTEITTYDPNNYTRFLREDEHILPNRVFDAYAETISCSCSNMSNAPVGGYITKNFLDTRKEQEEFRKRLMQEGFSRNDIRHYEKILTKPDIIIFRESILTSKNPDFTEALPHERFHKEMAGLSEEELRVLHNAYDNIIHKEYTPEEAEKEGMQLGYYEIKMWEGMAPEAKEQSVGIPLLADKQGGKVCMYATKNWGEFYPYLAQGEFLPRVEKVLERENPEAYEIYSRIKEKCELE